jgi:hypothetical protein
MRPREVRPPHERALYFPDVKKVSASRRRVRGTPRGEE